LEKYVVIDKKILSCNAILVTSKDPILSITLKGAPGEELGENPSPGSPGGGFEQDPARPVG
jgi:hypothetical protein